MNKYSKIDNEYHKQFYFQRGNAFARNTLTLSQSRLSNKITINNLNDVDDDSISTSKSNIYIKKFVKHYIKNKYSIDNRSKYYKYICKKLKNIKELSCLKPNKYSKGKKLYDGYSIDNTINLEKQIGSDSRYGSIFITSIKKTLGKYPIAAKVMKVNKKNSFENEINNFITQNILRNNLSKHFVFTYKSIMCANATEKVPYIIKNEIYYILLNELAHGDLKQLNKMKTYVIDDSTVYNVFIQTILSIMTFHYTGYTHNDCHYGNFLYHRNKEEGYYHYIINDVDYYLKSSKYNIMIFDFGFAKKINADSINDDVTEDYLRIFHAFPNKKKFKNAWTNYVGYPSNEFSDFVIFLYNRLNKLTRAELTKMKCMSTLINDILLPRLLEAPKNIFTKTKPKDKILNKTPFVINKTLHNSFFSRN